MTTALKNEIKKIARESVREALKEELTLLRALHLPYVSKSEQLDVERRYGKKPSRKVVKSFSFDL